LTMYSRTVDRMALKSAESMGGEHRGVRARSRPMRLDK
jgi:hypothetical protein